MIMKIDTTIAICAVVGIFIAIIFAASTQPILATIACDALSIVMIIGVVALRIGKKPVSGLGYLGVFGLVALTAYLHIHYHIKLLGGKNFGRVVVFVLLILGLSGISLLMNRNLPRK